MLQIYIWEASKNRLNSKTSNPTTHAIKSARGKNIGHIGLSLSLYENLPNNALYPDANPNERINLNDLKQRYGTLLEDEDPKYTSIRSSDEQYQRGEKINGVKAEHSFWPKEQITNWNAFKNFVRIGNLGKVQARFSDLKTDKENESDIDNAKIEHNITLKNPSGMQTTANISHLLMQATWKKQNDENKVWEGITQLTLELSKLESNKYDSILELTKLLDQLKQLPELESALEVDPDMLYSAIQSSDVIESLEKEIVNLEKELLTKKDDETEYPKLLSLITRDKNKLEQVKAIQADIVQFIDNHQGLVTHEQASKLGEISIAMANLSEVSSAIKICRQDINKLNSAKQKVALEKMEDSTIGKNPDALISIPTGEDGAHYHLDALGILEHLRVVRKAEIQYGLVDNNCAVAIKNCILAGISKDLREAILKLPNPPDRSFFEVVSMNGISKIQFETQITVRSWIFQLQQYIHQANEKHLTLQESKTPKNSHLIPEEVNNSSVNEEYPATSAYRKS